MRLLERLRAWFGGYFWLPCPICGRMFGGHEILNIETESHRSWDGSEWVVCPDLDCKFEAWARKQQHSGPSPRASAVAPTKRFSLRSEPDHAMSAALGGLMGIGYFPVRRRRR
jgi:hypothetical protein